MLIQKLILFVLLTIAACHNECFDKVNNDSLISECCKSIYDDDYADDDAEVTRIAEKCPFGHDVDDNDVVICMLKELGVLANGKINATAMIAIEMKGMKDIWKKAMTDSVNTCIEKMAGKKWPEDYFFDCMEAFKFSNCPKSEWTENDKCNTLKKSLVACV